MHQRHIRSLYKQIMRPLHNLMSFLVNDMYKGSSSFFFFVTLMKCDKPLSLISFTHCRTGPFFHRQIKCKFDLVIVKAKNVYFEIM